MKCTKPAQSLVSEIGRFVQTIFVCQSVTGRTKPQSRFAQSCTKQFRLVIGILHKACTKLHMPSGHSPTDYVRAVGGPERPGGLAWRPGDQREIDRLRGVTKRYGGGAQ